MPTVFPALRYLFLLAVAFLGLLPAQAASILFVVGNTTLGSGDARVKSLLESKGHVLTIESGPAAAATDANGKALVIISSTVTSTDVNTKFRTVAVPVMVWEPYIMDDMGMTNGAAGTDYGTMGSVTQVQINLPSHQMAAGFNGGVAVFDAVATATWGVAGSNALKVATLTTDANKATIYGYETGAGMFGLNAPARRVGFFFDDTSPSVLSGNGEKLFHAAVNWAMGISQPVITAQPVSVNVNAGQTAGFSVTATGGSLNYQWRKSGVNIDGATSSSYVTPATTSADNGALFSVKIWNSADTVYSDNAALTVGTSGPVIATHPQSKAVREGQIATFTVEAAGTPPLTYQWKRGGANVGTNSSSYTLPPATLQDHGATFTCVVTNSAGSATSQTATLIVVAYPHEAATQYYDSLNGSTPSFKLGWQNDPGNSYVYVEQGGLERMRLQDDYVHIPEKLYFGPKDLVGFRWATDTIANVDTLALGTGLESPQFDVLKVVRTPEGIQGVDFPLGLDFPIRQVQDPLDPNLTWQTNGDADAEGATFHRTAAGTSYATQEDGSLSSNRVGLTQTYSSTEVGHEFKLQSEAALDAGQLRISNVYTSGGGAPAETATVVDAYSIQTGTVVAKTLVTTPKWRVASTMPDYVLKPGYPLKSLEEVEAYARKHHHLENFQSAEEMSEHGVDLTQFNLNLLKTMEEMTLHMAAMNKELKSQKAELEGMKKRLRAEQDGKAGVR